MGLATEVIRFALKHNLGIIQMPCPEFTFCGNPRPSRTKDEYEMLPGFREHCEDLAKVVVKQLKMLTIMGEEPRIQILAVIGVKRSPSCAVNSALRRINDKILHTRERGIFIEILEDEMLEEGLNPLFLEFDFDEPNEIVRDLARMLR